jgi:GNAT superfamily N-acetyltransferase
VTAQPFVVLRHEDKYVGDFWLVQESLPMGEWEKGDAWVLAYALLPEFWGKGVGTAAVKTVIEWAEETLGVREIVAVSVLVPAEGRRVLRSRPGFQIWEPSVGAREVG